MITFNKKIQIFELDLNIKIIAKIIRYKNENHFGVINLSKLGWEFCFILNLFKIYFAKIKLKENVVRNINEFIEGKIVSIKFTNSSILFLSWTLYALRTSEIILLKNNLISSCSIELKKKR